LDFDDVSSQPGLLPGVGVNIAVQYISNELRLDVPDTEDLESYKIDTRFL
jgi:hypothetical protein